MIVRLGQKTKHATWEMYELQKYALHESIMIVLHLDGTNSMWVQSLAQLLWYAWKHQEKIPCVDLLITVVTIKYIWDNKPWYFLGVFKHNKGIMQA